MEPIFFGRKNYVDNGLSKEPERLLIDATPQLLAYFCIKYKGFYELSKQLAEKGLFSAEKVEILKKIGAKRAMRRFMAAVGAENPENDDKYDPDVDNAPISGTIVEGELRQNK